MIQWFTLVEFEQLCFDIAANSELAAVMRPIPPFSTRYPGVLESCLAVPLQTFDQKDLYPSLIDKAAMLFYLLNKNHGFENGNKRVAFTALLVLLYRNRLWMIATDDEMYIFSIYVASSEASAKEAVMRNVRAFINSRMCSFRQAVTKYFDRPLVRWIPPKRRGKKWEGFPRRLDVTCIIIQRHGRHLMKQRNAPALKVI